MRVVTTGSRTWIDYGKILDRLALITWPEDITIIPEQITIVTGTAAGADRLCEKAARFLGYQVERHPADWNRYGRSAGFKRNREMLDGGCDLVLAFWDGSSRGTAHVINEARVRGLALEIVR